MSFRTTTAGLRPALLRNNIVRTSSPSTSTPVLHFTRALSATPHPQLFDKKAAFKSKGKGQQRQHRKIPIPGEAQAAKRKVALTNPNAHLVPLEELSSQTLERADTLGKMHDFSLPAVEKLRGLGMFWPKRNWEMFRRPASLVREETMEVGRIMRWVEGKGEERNLEGLGVASEKGRWAARIVYGKKKAGKSVLLMQAAAYATERNWIVMSVPEARDLVINHTAYEHDPDSGLWLQKEYMAAFLERMLTANPMLKKLPVTLPSRLTGNQVPKNVPLSSLIETGIDDNTVSTVVFDHLCQEFSRPNSPPVLFVFDNINQVCQLTKYRDPNFNPIHGFDFAINKLTLDFLNYRVGFNKSFMLAATSLSTPPKMRSIDVGIEKLTPDPYEKLDQRVVGELRNVQTIKVGDLDRKHGRQLMDYVKRSGLLLMEPDCGIEQHDQFAEKYAVSGGVTGELLEHLLQPRIIDEVRR